MIFWSGYIHLYMWEVSIYIYDMRVTKVYIELHASMILLTL